MSFPIVVWILTGLAAVAIVLIGTAYWEGLLGWLRETALAEGKINAQDLDMMVLTDDVDEAVALMVAAREHRWPTPAPERPE